MAVFGLQNFIRKDRMTSKSVGLLVMTRIHGKLQAVLHRRGEFNPETMAPETNPGVWHVTMHECLLPDESLEIGLLRGTKEELGDGMARILEKSDKTPIGEIRSRFFWKTYFGVYIQPDSLRLFQLDASSGGIKPFTIKEFNQLSPLLECDNASRTISYYNQNVVFENEIPVVRRAFHIYMGHQ